MPAPWNLSILLTTSNLPKIRLVTSCRRPKVVGGSNSARRVGKQFHTAEPTFRRFGLPGWFECSSGCANLSPKRWQPALCELRRALARRLRDAFGSEFRVASGALGISKRICALDGRLLRTANNIPPALTLRAVANSRNSFPFSSRLRTKTGMARGSRGHFRLSPCLSLERTLPPFRRKTTP